MSNTEKPDVATVDGSDVASRLAFADKAESLLRRVLVALGYDNADQLTPMALLTGITAWVSMLQFAKLDTFGRYAQTWWEAFKLAWQVHPTEQATQCATDAMNAFARMFPPTLSANEESERDTINDIAALSEELDRQTVMVAGLQSENATLLKANERHASELAKCRIECEEQANSANELRTRVNAVDTIIAERDALKAQLDAFRDNMRGALVPLDKPKTVSPGQTWQRVYHVIDLDHRADPIGLTDGARLPLDYMKMLQSDDWIYLGTDKV